MRPPTDKDVIPGKWVYKVKLGPTGQVEKKQSTLCGKRFQTGGRTGLLRDFCAYLQAREIQDSTSTVSEAGPCDAPV